MPYHKTRNTFYRITWEINSLLNEIWPVYAILQKKTNLSKSSTKTAT